MTISKITGTLAACALLGSMVAYADEDAGARFTATLNGASEAPNPGDTDGAGTVTILVNPGREQLCYTLNVSGIAPATAAHIHKAPVGTAGPVIVGLTAPTEGNSKDCAPISRELAKEIIQNPGDYYVNVHNSDFPSGAVRGQLGR